MMMMVMMLTNELRSVGPVFESDFFSLMFGGILVGSRRVDLGLT